MNDYDIIRSILASIARLLRNGEVMGIGDAILRKHCKRIRYKLIRMFAEYHVRVRCIRDTPVETISLADIYRKKSLWTEMWLPLKGEKARKISRYG
ncbi:hypothetical protein [Thiothrix lacustris]|uniref:hypothetical protein n=1 Tax=Thiothrix lacustris TaxID=525917 RepID=UPI0027E4BBC7|nr:hypothetical protein [Thiothrix lacustris]WMP17497.1 hypothetical protein RCS87_00140 [Thiothrix lacustris]